MPAIINTSILFAILGDGSVKSSQVRWQLPPMASGPHNLVARIRNHKGTRVRMSELAGHPNPGGKVGPKKGRDQPKAT